MLIILIQRTCRSAKYEFACMTFLSPETVTIFLCQCSIIMDIQSPPVPNQPKTPEILAQNASKMHLKRTLRQPGISVRWIYPPGQVVLDLIKHGGSCVVSPLL